jgi:hypothetical protein
MARESEGEAAVRLADALDVSMDELVGRDRQARKAKK